VVALLIWSSWSCGWWWYPTTMLPARRRGVVVPVEASAVDRGEQRRPGALPRTR
jgi:hypothetical protein